MSYYGQAFAVVIAVLMFGCDDSNKVPPCAVSQRDARPTSDGTPTTGGDGAPATCLPSCIARLFRPDCLGSGQCITDQTNSAECYENGVVVDRIPSDSISVGRKTDDGVSVGRKTDDGVFVQCYIHKDFVDEMGQRHWIYYDSRRMVVGVVNFPSKDSRTGTAICTGGAQYPVDMDSPQCQDRLKSFGRLDFDPSGPRCRHSTLCSFRIVDDLPDAGPG
jgi:hypothetical protein